jgi:MYXO-CTERM domain-containing protein
LRVVKAEAGMTMSWPYVIFGVLVLVLLFSYRRRHRRSNIPLRHAAATASTARDTAKLS